MGWKRDKRLYEMNIKGCINRETAKKIFGSSDNAKQYLIALDKIKGDVELNYKEISRGINKGKKRLDMKPEELFEKIILTWNYNLSLRIIRNLFKLTKKYENGKNAKNKMGLLIKEWNAFDLGEIKWPCSQGAFDEFVQRVNHSNAPNKDELVSKAAKQYRRMKEINTVRNDFIEIEIFEKNENILPTLKHARGTDYFIDGESFDQKVAKSPTNEFKKEYGKGWREKAIKNPEIVAEYLYKYQDEGRFGADSRILIVYLDENVDLEKIEKVMDKVNLTEPLKIKFTYHHKVIGNKDYEVKCFIIILFND